MPEGVEKRRERRRRRLSEDLAVVRRRRMRRVRRARMREDEGGDLGREEGLAFDREVSGGGGSVEGIVVVDGWSGEDSIMCDAPEDSGSIELDA